MSSQGLIFINIFHMLKMTVQLEELFYTFIYTSLFSPQNDLKEQLILTLNIFYFHWILLSVIYHGMFIFQRLKLLYLAKDHWWGFITRNAHMVHIVNYREKRRDLTQSCDKNPYTHRTIQKATWQHNNTTKNFDYTTVADRLRTVSWSNSSHPIGVVKPVYERSTFPLTAKVVYSIVHVTIEVLFIIQTDFHRDGNMLMKNQMKHVYDLAVLT